MSGLSKGLAKVEVALRWDPSPLGEAPHDLDLVAATYTRDTPSEAPEYLVHHDSRSPDGTISLDRDSRNGQGFGFDEVMTLELDRLSESFVRVVVGAVIQQAQEHKAFGAIEATAVRIRGEDDRELFSDDFTGVASATAATVAEFVRDDSGAWELNAAVHGFDGEPAEFTAAMGATASR
ncbi:TerD family protein [Streptomyces sp. NPDC058045]|uniref:TerD family protein n=1 Tax=Streptomyces sp. NPDC058045 TaxID=3346311 RepID=UPI0036F09FB2